MKVFRTQHPQFDRRFRNALDAFAVSRDVSGDVTQVLAEIERDGDKALSAFTLRFDGIRLRPRQFRIEGPVLEAAARRLDRKTRKAMRESIRSVKAFHQATRPKNWEERNAHGARVGERFYPLRRVGVYIPGGAVPLVSSVIMNTIPAQMAGVPEIAVFTPPRASDPGGLPAETLLGALHLCGIGEVYRLGGIQAVGAAAFGTRTVPRVEKVLGPGNAYVNEAKRQVFGRVGIDSQPGPSEVMVIADDGAEPAHVAADLLAQAEHGTGKEKVFLVTWSEAMVGAVKAAIREQTPRLSHRESIEAVLKDGFLCVVVTGAEEAAEVANLVAPEHLELQVADRDLARLTRMIHCAGAILQGYHTPTVLGDFVAGPSHTLPTGRSARFFSGLRLSDFMRRTSVVRYGRKQLENARETVAVFSAMEQLDAHGRSLEIRLDPAPGNEEPNHG